MEIVCTSGFSSPGKVEANVHGSKIPIYYVGLKLQYFGYLMQITDSFEKTLMLGKIEGGRRRGRQRMRRLDGITDSKDVSLGDRSHVISACAVW